MGGDANPLLQPLTTGQLLVDQAYEPAFEEGDDHRTVIPGAQGMTMAKHSAKDALPALHLRTKNPLGGQDVLLNKNPKDLFTKFFFFVVVTLKILDGEFDALYDEIIAVRFDFAIQEVLLLTNYRKEALLLLPLLQRGDATLDIAG